MAHETNPWIYVGSELINLSNAKRVLLRDSQHLLVVVWTDESKDTWEIHGDWEDFKDDVVENLNTLPHKPAARD